MKKAWLSILAIALSAQAQNPVFTLNDASTYAAAQSGMGLGNTTSYDTYQLKNLFVDNPGMQPQMVRIVKTADTGSSTTSLVTKGDYDGVASNGFVGYTLFVAAHAGSGTAPGNGTGGAQGQSAVITANTANNTGTGTTTITIPALSSAITANDTVYLFSPATQTTTYFGFETFGWFTGGTGTVAIDTADVPGPLNTFPAPVQCVKMTNTSGQTSSISTYMDMGSSLNYIFSGGYHESLMINVLSGTPTLTMTGNPSGSTWSNAVSPTGGWATYTTTFTGTQTTGSSPANVQLGFTLSGTGSVCVMGAVLTADSDNNPTVWRNQVVTDLQTMKVGEIRYNMTGVQGTTLLNWITPMVYRQPSNIYVAGSSSNGTSVQTGLHDFLVLAQYLNLPRVAIVVPNTWNSTDMSNFIDYLAGGSGTTYGAYRIALGQTAAWSTVFSKIIIEYGNEVWNSTFDNSYIPGYGANYWNYVELATTACGAAKANVNYNTSVMKCAGSIQTASGPYEIGLFTAYDTSHEIDIYDAEGYTQGGVNTCTAPALYRSGNTEVWAHANDASDATSLYQTANSGVPIYIYEYNNAANSGGCTQLQMTGYAGGESYGLVDILEPMYLNKKWGITDFNFWSLNQRYVSSGGVNMEDFGIKTGPGGALNNLRPSGYALGLMNGAINGGTGYAVTESNTPVYSPPAENGVNAETNVPYLNSFCFKNGTGRGCVVVNTDQTNPYTFTFAGTNPPQGTVTQVSYTSTNVTDNNESTLNVTNSTTTSSNPSSFTIPAHSALAVEWSTLAPPTYPAIDPFSTAGPVNLNGNWTNINTGGRFSGTVQQNSGVLSFSGGTGTDPIAVAYYSSEAFGNNQYAQFVIGPDTTFDTNSSPMIRVQPTTGNGYAWDYTTNAIRVWTSGAYTDLTMTKACPGVNIGDVSKIAAVGTTIYCIDVTTGSFGYGTDSTYSSGSPGVMIGSFSGHLLMSGPWQADCFPYSCNSVSATPYSPLYPWPNIIDYFSPNFVTVSLSAGAGWTICYTIDGSTPTATTPGTCSHGTTYSVAFTVSVTGLNTVKTLATQSGFTNSIENDYIYNIGIQTPVENGCQLFPSNSIFNTQINTAPIDTVNNPGFQSTYGAVSIFHDFYEAAAGGANGGIPYNKVGNSDPTYTITGWTVPSQSDNGPYSITANTVIENIAATGCTNTSGLPQSTDYHMLMVANLTAGCQLQEMYQASCVSGSPNVWSGYSGAVWTLSSNALRTNGYTSADAAGLPITPFLVKYDEAVSGVIQHPFRFTLNATGNTYLWPARHEAGRGGILPTGSRIRLKSSFVITGYSPMNQVILQALKTYGMFEADNGIDGYFQGVTDPRWTETDLDLLNSIPFSNFEVINEQGFMAAGVNSGQAFIPSVVTSKVYSGKEYFSSIH